MTQKYKLSGSKGRQVVKLESGDLVWLQLRKDRFLELRKSKLMPRADGPFKIFRRLVIIHISLSCLPSLGLVSL